MLLKCRQLLNFCRILLLVALEFCPYLGIKLELSTIDEGNDQFAKMQHFHAIMTTASATITTITVSVVTITKAEDIEVKN